MGLQPCFLLRYKTGRNFLLKLFIRQLCVAKVLRRDKQELIFNEVNIQMIDRRLQELLFAKRIDSYELSKEACERLKSHGINAFDRSEGETPYYIDLPRLSGSNVKEHFESIASHLSKPYLQIIGRLSSLPEMPKSWKLLPGWTAYTKNSYFRVDCPPDEVLVFDTEVLVNEGHAPAIAVAASPDFWYLWVSPRLLSSMRLSKSVIADDLIRFYPDGSPLSPPKCIIGHFVSYDRARILEEYMVEPTGLRFLDTMSLHICVSGLTSTQRNLKLASDKHLYNNKLWKDFVAEHNSRSGSNDPESLDWIKGASLNSLLDVFKFYCQKEPYQNKDLRSLFEKGSKRDVIDNFQALVTYCANDVIMTFETFQILWKLYQERFPHPATFYGLLEMGSMYLPINSSWIDFQERANQSYDDLNKKQKMLLQRLAEDALQRHNGSDRRWYRELIPKPMKDNYKGGPALITAQMKLAPKLLRLCWKGLPLHYDQILKWGTLIPGRVPKPIGDPRYYEQSQSDESPRRQILPAFKVTKMSAAGPDELIFPYREYLQYWMKEMEERLCGVNSRTAFEARSNPDPRDDVLLGELRRSVELMPLDLDTVKRLISSLKKISDGSRGEQVNSKAKGALFWENKNRYETNNSVRWTSASRRKKLRRSATDTINPEIPTCWFCPLPNEAGTGLPVGSPLSKSFQVHIASGRLYSSPAAGGSEDRYADQILHDHIRASFWQSYSKRVIALRKGTVPCGRRYGAILPQVIAAGTISRRAVEPLWLTASNADPERLGSEIKALVQAPPGFCFVGADVDSQEMWIASLIGDSVVGFQGNTFMQHFEIYYSGTPYGWMTLEGSKAKGTDLHTKTANLIGIKRNEAKVLNYARLYGSGLEFTKHLLSKFQSNLRPEEASLKAEKLMRATKGRRVPVDMGEGWKGEAEIKYIWKDGTESCVFNALEAIARSPEPRTPVLGAQITRTLTPKVVKDDVSSLLRCIFHDFNTSGMKAAFEKLHHLLCLFTRWVFIFFLHLFFVKFLPSRINWVVQSSAVDYLHCLLVFMAWLIKKYNLCARLCISIHDEVRYLCDQRCTDQIALALQVHRLPFCLSYYDNYKLPFPLLFFQISNLLTRALFAFQLGMHDLPESVAYFSSVEIDTCLRKDPLNDCKTPSNPDGLEVTYNIPKGRSLTITEIIERTGGAMEPFDNEACESATNASQSA
ncbi:unnamed protein product [Taenia asiatica]|uniref:Mitochondrial DNA polymerase catalytic subunit n=1 Tax=Taenia asiatica TaxID=60517 RepID=A0A0R3WCY3_TAEAS|nr:unnamed protein product [Taenia asiatica]